ncbi:MAG: LamG domain-containing protein [Chitinophagaceae bacterium]|nr:LamG domain-containing protein [Chitinophagaceae bacterium]
MKIKSLTLSVSLLLLFMVSCKKSTTEPTPVPPVPNAAEEQMSPASGKAVHYLFNGNTRDTSGNNNHGGEAGYLAYGSDRFDRANRSLVLNGSNARTEVVGLNQTFPFSYSLWLNTPTPEAVMSLFQSDRTANSYFGSWLQMSISSPNKLAFNIGNGGAMNGNSRNSLLSSVALSANQWYHLVINARGANDMDLYINGVKDNSAVYDGDATQISYSGPSPIGLIGAAFSGQNFNGKIDDFRAYNRTLTPTEVAALYSFHP